MAQPNPYDRSLINILRTVVNSSWPLYEFKLEQSAERFYPGGMSITALRKVAIPKLRQLFSHVANSNQLFAQLRDFLDEVSIMDIVQQYSRECLFLQNRVSVHGSQRQFIID